jgi:hypothetical protein
MEIILAFIGIILFGLFDYFGFHVSYKRGWADFGMINKYRIAQFIFQIIISALLFIAGGWFAVFAFNFLWWTWWADLLFYFFYDTLRFFGYPRKPGGFKEQVLGNKITWAFWTPLGLIKHRGRHKVLKYYELMGQCLTGLLIVILLYLIR